jgi:L-amino acid N-acyltransferase YncA
MKARLATITDVQAIARIYNQGIEDRIATFETQLRSTGEIEAWFSKECVVVVAVAGTSWPLLQPFLTARENVMQGFASFRCMWIANRAARARAAWPRRN